MKHLVFICLTLITTMHMQAQDSQYPTQVHVNGTGTVTVVPDQVSITVRVENTGKDAIGVKRENDNTVREVLAFLDGANVPANQVKTDYIRLSKNYEYNTKTYNYAANQSITIRLTNLAQYEPVMNGLLNSGVNRIDQVVFGASNNDELQSQARKKAMENAKLKATEYAAALGQQIGAAITISEQGAAIPPMQKNRMMAFSAEDAGSAPAMAPGELEIRVQVQVSFVLR